MDKGEVWVQDGGGETFSASVDGMARLTGVYVVLPRLD